MEPAGKIKVPIPNDLHSRNRCSILDPSSAKKKARGDHRDRDWTEASKYKGASLRKAMFLSGSLPT